MHHERTHPSLESRLFGSRQHFLGLRKASKNVVLELVLDAFMLPMQWYSSASGRAGYGFMNNFQMRVVNERLEIRARVPFRLLSNSMEVHRRSYIGFPTERLEDLRLQRGHQD